MAGSDRQRSPEEIERERWLDVRRRDRRLIAFAALVLLAGTIYAGILNIIAIYGASGNIPFTLEIDHNLPLAQTVSPRLYLSWEGGDLPVRPILLLDGETEIPADSGRAIPAGLSTRRRLEIRIPDGCSVGRHSGLLHVYQTEIGGDTLLGHAVPVSIPISGSVWHNWFILRYWLIFSIVLMAFAYVGCWVIFPRPSGTFVFDDPFDAHQVRRPRIPLKMRRSAWFLPWLRSSIPLKELWKRAGVKVPLRAEGEISFLFSHLPPILLMYHYRNVSIYRLSAEQCLERPLDIDGGGKIGNCEHMHGGRRYAYQAPNNPNIILFYFER